MFQSSTILRELVQSLAKVIFLSKRSVKLCHHILFGDEAACCETAHMPFHDMLPHLYTIYSNIILLNVLTEILL